MRVADLVRKAILVCIVSVSLLAIGCAEKPQQPTGKSSTTVTSAKQSESTSTAGSNSQAKIEPYKGEVDSVDSAKKTMSVLKGNAGMAIMFDVSKAKLVGYKRIRDIKPGDNVTVEYKVESGYAVAKTITKK